MFILCSVLFLIQEANGFVQQNSDVDPESKNFIELSSVVDTTIIAEAEFVRIALSENSYLILQPGTRIGLTANEAEEGSLNISIELISGGLFLNTLNNRNPRLELLVNGSLVTVDGVNAGVHTMGFYWVEDGQLQVMSLNSGNQITIRKGMYAQLESSGSEFINGNLSASEMRQLSLTYRSGQESTVLKTYQLGFTDSGEYVVREVINNLPDEERE
jgi:hypothetical protein